MAKTMYKTQLHDGEVEVMILAKEIAADVVIIDDANAKKHAKYLELPVTGTLGALIKAKKEGYVDELKPNIASDGRGRYLHLTEPDRVVFKASGRD